MNSLKERKACTLKTACTLIPTIASLKGNEEQKTLNLAYLMTAEYILHINSSRTLDWGSFPRPSECLDTGRDSAMVC